jgi:hypothetical protein
MERTYRLIAGSIGAVWYAFLMIACISGIWGLSSEDVPLPVLALFWAAAAGAGALSFHAFNCVLRNT